MREEPGRSADLRRLRAAFLSNPRATAGIEESIVERELDFARFK